MEETTWALWNNVALVNHRDLGWLLLLNSQTVADATSISVFVFWISWRSPTSRRVRLLEIYVIEVFWKRSEL